MQKLDPSPPSEAVSALECLRCESRNPAVELEGLAGSMRQRVVKEINEAGDGLGSVEPVERVGCQDFRPAFFRDIFSHPSFKKSWKDGVHPDVRIPIFLGQ